MVRNELQIIEDLLFNSDFCSSKAKIESSIKLHCKQICEAWENAVFSDLPEHSLMRYFHYHLEGISKILDAFSKLNNFDSLHVNAPLLKLINHLKKYYSSYFNLDAYAPVVYHQSMAAELAGKVSLVLDTLKTARLSPALKTCLINRLNEVSETSESMKYSFRSLQYLESLVNQIPKIDLHSDSSENRLIIFLSHSNFNHLAFFVYRQHSIRGVSESFNSIQERLDYFYEQKAVILSCPEEKKSCYDACWPSLKIMLSEWLQEEIHLNEKALFKERETRAEESIPKLPIAMSVAHMACLIRLLFEESVFVTQNLKLIFKSFAGHYQTKRQSVISPGSLSKEFYSIDQHTAARVRDLLQKMVQRINHNFFPLFTLVNLAVLSYQSIN